ncbi:MAG TPA: DUF1565 domain-containing protein [Planctomycetota bacterium]|nr:DUF1565 domain-containing protein [Planctomycetota bacterium]
MKNLEMWMRAGLFLGLGLVVPACNYGNNYYNGPYSVAWYVDPVGGTDAPGFGSPGFPFRTIRFALLQALSGDTIFLATGTYSASTETFPILLKPGVTVIGDPASSGATTSIVDGGNYTISGGSQAGSMINAGVVMASGSSLSGVKISVSGVGAVFDGANASLTNCTLTGCGVSGVQVFQSASPTLASNIITQSGGAGVVTFDTSAPILRQNSISSNATDGVLANDSSIPNLGDPLSPGANTLQSNTQEGLANNTAASAIPAAGNTWNSSVQGADTQGHYAAGAANPALVGTNYSMTNSPAASIQF